MEKSKTPISDFDYLINEGNSSGIDQTPTQTKLDEEKGTTKSPESKRVIIAPELYPIFLFFLTKTYQNSIYFTFISFPNSGIPKESEDGKRYVDLVHPTNQEFRQIIEDKVLDAYNAKLEEMQDEVVDVL